MRFHGRSKCTLLACLASTAMPTIAVAQDKVAETTNPGQAEADVIGDIVVTATRRAKSAQDVGVAVTALSGDDLRGRSIDNAAALAAAVPGVKLVEATGGGVPVIIIRGVGLQDFRVNNTPAAAIYVDDVYQVSVAQAGFTFFDLDRLEILRGPQGGLYGRNTTAGAVQVVSRKPNFDRWTAYAETGVARFGTASVEGAVGGPVTDTLAVRVAGRGVFGSSGPYRSIPANRYWGAENRFALRGVANWKPTQDIDVLVKVHGGADRSETPLLRAVPLWVAGTSAVPGIGTGAFTNYVLSRQDRSVVCPDLLAGRRPDLGVCGTLIGATPASLGLTDSNKFDTLSNPLNKLDNRWWGASAQIGVDLGSVKLTSITAFDNFKVGRFTDWDATPVVFQHIDYRSNIDAVSQEVRLAYSSSAVDLLLGVNYARDVLTEASTLFADTGVVPFAFGTKSVQQPYRQKTEQVAGYGRVDWRFAPRLTAVVEGRYTSENKTFAGGTFLVDSSRYLVQVDKATSFGDYSGKVALEYRPSRNLLIYGSVSRGYKSGGFFGGIATRAAQLDPYQPEIVVSYEGGLKSELFDRRLRFNLSGYYYDYSNIQGFGAEPSGAVRIQRLTNLGDARYYGGELELTVIPATGFTVSGNVSYTDAKITSSTKLAGDAFSLANNRSYVGINLPNYSKWSLGGLANYSKNIGNDLKIDLQADVTYRSAQDLFFIFIPEERPLFREPGYAFVGARVSLGTLGREGRGWEAAAFVKNLFDTTYRNTARTDSFGGFFEVYSLPRTYGVTLRYGF